MTKVMLAYRLASDAVVTFRDSGGEGSAPEAHVAINPNTSTSADCRNQSDPCMQPPPCCSWLTLNQRELIVLDQAEAALTGAEVWGVSGVARRGWVAPFCRQ